MNPERDLMAKVLHQGLSMEEAEQLFRALLQQLGEILGIELVFEVQDTLAKGFARCVGRERKPALGAFELQVLVFCSVRSRDEDLIVCADVLSYSRGFRLASQHARTGEFIRFLFEEAQWTVLGWQGDEYGEYEQYMDV